MEEFEGRSRRGMLTMGEWCDPVSNMLHHMKKGVEWEEIEHERFVNSGSVLTGLPRSLQR